MPRLFNPRTALASNLKRIRSEKQFSQKALAEKAGVFTNCVSDIENSKGNPSLDTLSALAKALNVSLSDLLG
jgi:transcriptional regulator with XRE-family HTH domain